MNMYYIQNGYVGNAIAWWKADSKGYTWDLSKAGKFNEEEAKKIVGNGRGDVAWPVHYIDTAEEAKVVAIDIQYLDRSKKISQS